MSKRTKASLTAGLKIGVSIALVVVLVLTADIQEIAGRVAHFKPLSCVPVFFFILLGVVLSSLKWGILLKAQGILIPAFRLFQYYTAGFFFNNFLPSSIGCDGIRVMLLKKEFNSYAGAASSVVMERVLATVTLSLLGLAGALFARSPSRPAIIALSGVFVLGVILTVVQLTGFVPRAFAAGTTKFALGWKNFASASTDIRKHPVYLLICLAESLLFQMSVALAVGSIIFGLGLPSLPLADLFFVSSASSVVAMIPLGVNGYGFREGGYIYLLAPLGYAASGAFSISILFALFVAAYSLLGAVFWITIQRRMRRR
ncbi:hypothetical protein AGMMS49942_10270 [Spirochaetia bacterium]|nr:hypothetical protein AGMMS49942_10270 [Spirochaetia bacterium]